MKGAFAIALDCLDGKRLGAVEGEKFVRFGVHQDLSRRWTVSHLKSGCSVFHARTRAEAIKVAKILDAIEGEPVRIKFGVRGNFNASHKPYMMKLTAALAPFREQKP